MSIVYTTVTATSEPTTLSSQDAADAAKASASSAVASLSKAIASASAALTSESVIASGNPANPPAFKYIGLALAVGSGVLIGSSFVFKKKGLLASQKKFDTTAGEGHAYLKSPMWWTGMIIMVLGEIFNFVAYAFADAVLVTPLGALSVVICAVLSSVFLKERLTLFGKVGCFLCIVGSVIIALNAPTSHSGGKITEFQKLFLSPGFLTWGSLCIVTSLVLVFYFAPRYGKKHMLIYITICSLIGGLSVSVTSGLGAAILLSIRGDNQFKHWFIYFLLGFVIVTLLIEINYLNKALELFNTATVTPTYYVIFTGATLITSIILQQGLNASPLDIVTLVMGFLVICAGIVLLQLSKLDPEELLEDKPGLDRNTTLLIRASHSIVSHPGEKRDELTVEDPGVDTVRGGLGIVGSLIRARSSRRLSSANSWKHHSAADEYTLRSRHHKPLSTQGLDLERYQLQDTPLSPRGLAREHTARILTGSRRDTAIQFADGSDAPHGHHGWSKQRDDSNPPVTQFGAFGLNSITEGSNGSSKTGDISQQGLRSPQMYTDPYAPRSTSPLSQNGGTGLKTTWNNASYASSIGKTSSAEEESYGMRVVASRNDARMGSDGSSQSKSRDYPKIQPRGASKNRAPASEDEEEAEELLSPRLGFH